MLPCARREPWHPWGLQHPVAFHPARASAGACGRVTVSPGEQRPPVRRDTGAVRALRSASWPPGSRQLLAMTPSGSGAPAPSSRQRWGASTGTAEGSLALPPSELLTVVTPPTSAAVWSWGCRLA